MPGSSRSERVNVREHPGPLKRPFGGAEHVVDGVTAEAVYGDSNHRKRRLVPLPCRWALLTSLRAWTALVCRR